MCRVNYGLSHNNCCFPCNIVITNFLVSHTCKIRFHDVIYRTVRHYLPLVGMINIPIYLVWGCSVQLNSTHFFADHIIFNNGYMKYAHTRQRMTNNNNNNKRKQVRYLRQSRSAFLRNNHYFEIQT